MGEHELWRRRIEWKIDRLAYHLTLLSLAARRPMLQSLPPPRQRTSLWPVLFRLLSSYVLPQGGHAHIRVFTVVGSEQPVASSQMIGSTHRTGVLPVASVARASRSRFGQKHKCEAQARLLVPSGN
jgi:hypothetical protein